MKARLPQEAVTKVAMSQEAGTNYLCYLHAMLDGQKLPNSAYKIPNTGAFYAFSMGQHDESSITRLCLYNTLASDKSSYRIKLGITDNKAINKALTAVGCFAQLFPIVLNTVNNCERVKCIPILDKISSLLPMNLQTGRYSCTHEFGHSEFANFLDLVDDVWGKIDDSWLKWFLLCPLYTLKDLNTELAYHLLSMYRNMYTAACINPALCDLLVYGFSMFFNIATVDERIVLSRMNFIGLPSFISSSADALLDLNTLKRQFQNSLVGWRNLNFGRVVSLASSLQGITPLPVNKWSSFPNKSLDERFALAYLDTVKYTTPSKFIDIHEKYETCGYKPSNTYYSDEIGHFKERESVIRDAWRFSCMSSFLQERGNRLLALYAACSAETAFDEKETHIKQMGELQGRYNELAVKLRDSKSVVKKLSEENKQLKAKLAAKQQPDTGNTRKAEAEIAKLTAERDVLERRVNELTLKLHSSQTRIENLEQKKVSEGVLKTRIADLEAKVEEANELLALMEKGESATFDESDVTADDMAELALISADIVLPDFNNLRILAKEMPNSHFTFLGKHSSGMSLGRNKDFYFIGIKHLAHKHFYYWHSYVERTKSKYCTLYSVSHNAICHAILDFSRSLKK